MGTCAATRKTIKTIDLSNLNIDFAIQEAATPTFVFSKMYDRTFQFNNVDELVQPSTYINKNYLKHYKQIKAQDQVNLRRNQILVQHIFTRQIFIAELLDFNESTTEYVDFISNLQHPCLQNIIEIYQHNNQYVIILDYCNGGNLLQIQQNCQIELTPQQKLLIMEQIFNIMAYLHERKITHGNLTLKSFEKIDQSDNFAIKLVDLDCLLEKKKSNSFSLRYASPQIVTAYQQKQCIEPFVEDDLWAVGIIGAQVIYNIYPVAGKSFEQILGNIAFGRLITFPENSDYYYYNAKTLLNQLLQVEKENRISMSSALNSLWIQLLDIKSQKKEVPIVNQLQQVLAYMIAELFPDYSLTYLQQLKKAKKITRFQLTSVVRKNYKHVFNNSETISTVNSIFQEKQEISYKELVNKFTDNKSLITQNHLEVAFRRFCSINRVITIDDILPFVTENGNGLEQGFNQFPGSVIDQLQFNSLMYNYLLLN